jgi:hypothetical protein
MNASETLKSNLRCLIATTSSEEVYNTLTQIFKEDYAFLQKLYGKELPKKVTAVVEAPSIIPAGFPGPVVIVGPIPNGASSVAQPVQAADVSPPVQEEAPKIRADTKVRIVKKPTAPTDLPPVATLAPVVAALHTESGLRDPKDIKKWQKDQEDKKAAELRAAGINPASLLTEANMRKWVVEEKKTFAAIAREYVGLSDGVVASEAKKYGLQSDIAKRRAAIMGAKKAK